MGKGQHHECLRGMPSAAYLWFPYAEDYHLCGICYSMKHWIAPGGQRLCATCYPPVGDVRYVFGDGWMWDEGIAQSVLGEIRERTKSDGRYTEQVVRGGGGKQVNPPDAERTKMILAILGKGRSYGLSD